MPSRWFRQGGSGPTLVQSATNVSASGTTLVVTLPRVPTPGNILILCTGNNAGTPSSVVTTGVTWTAFQAGGVNFACEIYVGTAIQAAAGTGTTITLLTGKIAAIVMEWSGLQALPSDGKGTATGTSVAMSSGAPTGVKQNELVIATSVAIATISGGPTGGFTSVPGSPAGGATIAVPAAYQIGAASQAAVWTINSSQWDGAWATFKAA